MKRRNFFEGERWYVCGKRSVGYYFAKGKITSPNETLNVGVIGCNGMGN